MIGFDIVSWMERVIGDEAMAFYLISLAVFMLALTGDLAILAVREGSAAAVAVLPFEGLLLPMNIGAMTFVFQDYRYFNIAVTWSIRLGLSSWLLIALAGLLYVIYSRKRVYDQLMSDEEGFVPSCNGWRLRLYKAYVFLNGRTPTIVGRRNRHWMIFGIFKIPLDKD